MADEQGNGAKAPVCVFKKPVFKKKGGGGGGGGGNRRNNKRTRDDSSGDSGSSGEEEESVLLRKQAANSKGGGGKQSKTSSSDTAGPIGAYQSNRSTVPVEVAGGATYTSEIDTEHDRDQRAILEMAIHAQEAGVTNEDTKIYRGQAFYKSYVKKDESQIGGNKYTGTQGPIRAPAYLRATAVFDYKPDICKDYKETGYCGFGDGCKFMHDRGDYKSGYQMEQEWEAEQKRKKLKELGEWAGGSDDDDDDENKYVITEDDELPFACFICRDGFRDPVVTTCGHYFCSNCALEHNKKDPTCPACGEKTNGVFNFASKLFEKLKRDGEKKKAKQETEAKRAALGLGKGGGGGGGGDDDDEGGAEGGGEDEEGEGEEKLVIQEQEKETVVKKKKGAWSSV